MRDQLPHPVAGVGQLFCTPVIQYLPSDSLVTSIVTVLLPSVDLNTKWVPLEADESGPYRVPFRVAVTDDGTLF